MPFVEEEVIETPFNTKTTLSELPTETETCPFKVPESIYVPDDVMETTPLL